jgi:hypothetical protein
MKQIIDGKAYNTETASRIGSVQHPGWPYTLEQNIRTVQMTAGPPPCKDAATSTLYQTRGGAYFLVREERKDFSAQVDNFGQSKAVFPGLYPLTRKEALTWAEQHFDTGKLEAMFGEFPEAGMKSGTMLLRLPETLRRRMQAAAEEETQSLSAWGMRCMERCISLSEVEGSLARIFYITSTWTSRPDDDAFGKNALAEMIENVEAEVEKIVELLYLAGEARDLITKHAGSQQLDDLVGRWAPYEECRSAP